MNQIQESQHTDKQVRFQVYRHFLITGRAPTRQEVANALALPLPDVQEAYQRLAEGKALVLQKSGEVLMAEPFSAVPTAFVVEIGTRTWWGNCIWDALGIPGFGLFRVNRSMADNVCQLPSPPVSCRLWSAAIVAPV